AYEISRDWSSDVCSSDLEAALGVVRPDAGQAVGLQFLAHQQAVSAFQCLASLARGVHLGGNAQQGLHMVAHLVGDHVGLGEVARSEERRVGEEGRYSE